MKIYVDADACPVKEQIISMASEAKIPVVLVKSFNHYSHEAETDGVETIYVDTGVDSADYRIMQLALANDIVITQDYGLASLTLEKNCTVLHHKGFRYTHENIDRLLHMRHASAKARKSGHKTKGPKPFTKEDKKTFEKALRTEIEKARK